MVAWAAGPPIAVLTLLMAARPARAHGVAPEPGSWLDVALSWSIEAHIILPLAIAFLLYRAGVRKVAREHPDNPVPRFRAWCWYVGLGVLLVALQSPVATYDTTLFSAHMVQHLLMAMIAAPLLALGAPITLLLRVSSPRTRRRVILPLLHSRPMRILAFPVLTWILFAGVMWATHFSSLYDAALENELAHLGEHALYMGAAMLFWWPVVGADPSPWRLPHAARVGYLFLGMPQSSFLGLAIFSAPQVLYEHYAALQRSWGPTPLADQQLAGGIMWAGGDAIFLIAMILAVWVWLRAEEEEGRRVDDRLARERTRLARERARLAQSQAVAESPLVRRPLPEPAESAPKR